MRLLILLILLVLLVLILSILLLELLGLVFALLGLLGVGVQHVAGCLSEGLRDERVHLIEKAEGICDHLLVRWLCLICCR